MTPYFEQDGVRSATWRGKPCCVVGVQDIVTSTGGVKRCAEIRLIGIPLFQGWRLVDAAEVVLEKKDRLTRQDKTIH